MPEMQVDKNYRGLNIYKCVVHLKKRSLADAMRYYEQHGVECFIWEGKEYFKVFGGMWACRED